jgi:hypothetical protein
MPGVGSITVADVEELDATNWQQLDSGVKSAELERAKRMINDQFSARVSTLPTLIGDEGDATKLLTAHFWELTTGGEAQSESSEGGSVTYNTVTGESLNSLSETRYGRQFSDHHLRDRIGIGVVRPK